MSDIELRQRIADDLVERLMPLCPFCAKCGTDQDSWWMLRVLEVVLDQKGLGPDDIVVRRNH